MLLFNTFWISIFMVMFLIIATFLKIRKKTSNMQLIFFLIFYIYILNVIKFTIFPVPFQSEVFIQEGQIFWHNVNFIPLKSLGRETILNVLLAIPYGFSIRFILKKVNIFIHVLLFGIIIESSQALISILINYNYRTIDINDIIANATGVIIGYLVYLVFSKISYRILSKFENRNQFLEHIYNSCK